MWQIIGQNRAVSLLQRSLEIGALAHAYLFVGPSQVGKMTLALNLAQALNCAEAGPPCGECVSCQKIISGKHADVQIIGLSHGADSTEVKLRKEISIDQIREVQHVANLPPFEGRYKVFIIDGADSVSTEAANCLLKTLEEPASKVVFILLTANERLLPATVVSRCQRVELLPMAISRVEEALIVTWNVEPAKAKLLSRLSRGCLGWAVSAAVDSHLVQQRVEHLDELEALVTADYEERFAYVSRLVTLFSQDRALVQKRLDLWLSWWRDLLLIKSGCSGDVTNLDRLDRMVDAVEGYSLTQVKDFIDSIRVAGEQLAQNASPRLVLETLMLAIPEPDRRVEKNPSARFEVNYG